MPRRQPPPGPWDCDTLTFGEVVGGVWQVDRCLGKGGFGVVYAVHDCRKRRGPALKGALKITLNEDIDDCHAADRIRQEAEILRMHDGDSRFPKLYGAGDYKGLPYFVRELLEPVDLSTLPESDDEKELSHFILSVLESVSAMHDKGWVHCDIKPWNVARRVSDDRYMLIDYGSSHHIEEDDVHIPSQNTLNMRNGQYVRVGSRGYDAPENSFSVKRDIYAIGHLIRDCFMDDVPFEWGKIINKCISNQPEHRYPNVESLRKDIENLEGIRDKVYTQLRKKAIVNQRKKEHSLAKAKRKIVRWDEILSESKDHSRKGMKVLLVVFPENERIHYIVKEPLVLEENTILLIEGCGLLEASIDGPFTSVVVLRKYANLKNMSVKMPPESDLTFVVSGPGGYLNFANIDTSVKETYQSFFSGRRRVLSSLTAMTALRFKGVGTFAELEKQTLTAIRQSKMPCAYKTVLVRFFKGEQYTLLPEAKKGCS